MIQYTSIDRDGFVLATGTTMTMTGILVPPGGAVLRVLGRLNAWWDGKVFHDIGVAPSSWHTFHRTEKRWLDARSLDEIRASRWAHIKAERNRLEQSGFPYLGCVFDSDPVSVQRITAAALAAREAIQAELPFELDWTLADNAVRSMSAEEIAGMPVALARHAASLHAAAQALRAEIAAAESAEEVEAVAWPAG